MQVAIVGVLCDTLSPSVNYLKGLEPPRGTMACVGCVWDTKIIYGTPHQALLPLLRARPRLRADHTSRQYAD